MISKILHILISCIHKIMKKLHQYNKFVYCIFVPIFISLIFVLGIPYFLLTWNKKCVHGISPLLAQIITLALSASVWALVIVCVSWCTWINFCIHYYLLLVVFSFFSDNEEVGLL